MKVKLNTGIPDDERMKIIEELNKLLADVYVTFVQSRNFHWNVVGPNFIALHSKFKELYEMMDTIGDDIAERIRALDGNPVATMAQWLDKASLKEVPTLLADEEMVVILINNLESIVSCMRELCEDEEDETDETDETEETKAEPNEVDVEIDEATETMLGAQMVDIEKQVWMLRSFLG